ncbi:MAG: sulfur carrier protein ThiS [Gammaproteobacteria bacterium]|nr:sulfur carrier protein ThiS [Gammaproteobacteria bacterium]
MHIFCNGDRVNLDVERLAEALERLGYTERRVVVAVNEAFVAKEEWPSYRVRAGDRLDVLSAIEGG